MSENQQQAADTRWAEVARKQPGAVIAAGGAVGYLFGYVQLGAYASGLGVQQSAFGLDFREHVVLAILNLAWIATLVVAYHFGLRWGAEHLRSWWTIRAFIGLAFTVLAVTSLWAVGVVVLDAPTWVPLSAFVLSTAAVAFALGAKQGQLAEMIRVAEEKRRTERAAFMESEADDLHLDGAERMRFFEAAADALHIEDPLRKDYSRQKKWIYPLLGLLAIAVVTVPAGQIALAAYLVRSGVAVESGTTLDLVIRPQPMVLLDTDNADLATGDVGRDVTLVSNRGEQAVYVQDKVVVVTPSTDLMFIAPPADETGETPSPLPGTE